MTLDEVSAIVSLIFTAICGIGYLYGRENRYVSRRDYYVKPKGGKK